MHQRLWRGKENIMSRKSRTKGKNNSRQNLAGTKLLKQFFKAKYGRKPREIPIDINVETGTKDRWMEVYIWRNNCV